MDWKQLLKELESSGWTQTRIAERCGVAQATVSDLARGLSREPKFGFGRSLIELHQSVTAAQEPEAKAA